MLFMKCKINIIVNFNVFVDILGVVYLYENEAHIFHAGMGWTYPNNLDIQHFHVRNTVDGCFSF